MIGLSEMWHEVNAPFSDPGYYAEDNSGKNITVVAGGEVDVSVLGDNKLTYDAYDGFNHAIQVTRKHEKKHNTNTKRNAQKETQCSSGAS